MPAFEVVAKSCRSSCSSSGERSAVTDDGAELSRLDARRLFATLALHRLDGRSTLPATAAATLRAWADPSAGDGADADD